TTFIYSLSLHDALPIFPNILFPDVFFLFLLYLICEYCLLLLLLSCLHLKIRNNAVPLAPCLPDHSLILSHLLSLHTFVDQRQFLLSPCLISYLFSLNDASNEITQHDGNERKRSFQ